MKHQFQAGTIKHLENNVFASSIFISVGQPNSLANTESSYMLYVFQFPELKWCLSPSKNMI